MSSHFDFAILGAGLAGVSLACELSKSGASICLVDPKGIAGGASGTPIGLVNPATGRYATKSWEAELCYQAILRNLEMVQQHSPVQFFKQNGVLRSALDEKIAERMKENAVQSDWPEGWIEWLEEKELKAFHPGISCTGGGVWLPIGITVDIETYLKTFAEYLTSAGVSVLTGESYQLSSHSGLWKLKFEYNELIADSVVVTAGVYSSGFPKWKELPLYPVKGQLAVLESDAPLPFDHAVSALGYIASLSSKQFVVGSTYEHTFENEKTDAEGLEYLLTRFGEVLPELRASSKVIHQWAGVRASTPNRKPFMGAHHAEENLFIFAGLGSKGLLYSGYLAELMAAYLLKNQELPGEIRLSRARNLMK